MKTAEEILNTYRVYLEGSGVEEFTFDEVIFAMKEYAIEVIDYILIDNNLIYSSCGEAMYDYEKFKELKNSLK